MASQGLSRAQTLPGLMERGEAGLPRAPTDLTEPLRNKPSWKTSSSAENKNDETDSEEAGYPALAEFMGNDERSLIARRFRHLSARLILEKQDEIRILEDELLEMDLIDHGETPRDQPSPKLTTRHRRNPEEAKARRKLFIRLEAAFKEYAELMDAVQKLTSFERPAGYEYRNVKDFVDTTKPVVQREAEWADLRADLVTLRGAREHAFLSHVLEGVINGVRQLFSRPSEGEDHLQDWLLSNVIVERFANFSIMAFLLLLVPFVFVVPIYALSRISEGHKEHIGRSIGVLTGFAVFFTFLLAAGTPAKQHEILSCGAAYLAVLVVFFGSIGTNGGFGRGS